jgi:hypothetical protein
MSSINPPNQRGELYPISFGRKCALVDEDLDLTAVDAHLAVRVRQSPARNVVVEDGLADDEVEKEEAGLCGSTKSEEPTTV